MRLHSISRTQKRSIILTSHRIHCCGNRPQTIERNLKCDRVRIIFFTIPIRIRIKFVGSAKFRVNYSRRRTWHLWLKIKRYSLNLQPGYCAAPELLQSSRIYSSNNKPEYGRKRERVIVTLGAKRYGGRFWLGVNFHLLRHYVWGCIRGNDHYSVGVCSVVYLISIKQIAIC